MSDRVLVTGINGFLGSHIALRLLEKGYRVRGTVRDVKKGNQIRLAFSAQGVDVTNLEITLADLQSDENWAEAVKDCRYVQHVAAPFPKEQPDNREALVPIMRAGTQRVLENALSAGVERFVMTSSIVAMIGTKGRGRHMAITENSWSDPDWSGLTPYAVGKTRSELSAWAYVEAQGLDSRLTTVCPGIVLGPDIFGNAGTSVGILESMFNGSMPRLPRLAYPIIDVRDCAAIHVSAMTARHVGRRRLIAASDTLWFREIADILRKHFPNARNLPKSEVPNFAVKMAALFDDGVRTALPDLGTFHEADNAYVTTLTQVMPRPAREAVIASAHSLFNKGRVAAE